jgi:hypothetical protein
MEFQRWQPPGGCAGFSVGMEAEFESLGGPSMYLLYRYGSVELGEVRVTGPQLVQA